MIVIHTNYTAKCACVLFRCVRLYVDFPLNFTFIISYHQWSIQGIDLRRASFQFAGIKSRETEDV